MGWSNGSVKDTSSETSTVDITLMGGACGQSHSVFREVDIRFVINESIFRCGCGSRRYRLGNVDSTKIGDCIECILSSKIHNLARNKQ
uniref:Mitochondrial chaperone BCS1 n=1 Tax=Parascaris univalens TaxID=6257 RepID=A0A915AYA2_PARUN